MLDRTSGCALGGAGLVLAGLLAVSADSLAGQIAGRVTAAEDGRPLAGVDLFVFDESNARVSSARSGADGHYRSDDLPSGAYFVWTVGSAGYVSKGYDDVRCAGPCSRVAATPVVVSGGGNTGGINLSLERGHTVSGRVTDAATGEPLANRTVDLHTRDSRYATSAQTGPDGRYTSRSALGPGRYAALLRRTGSEPHVPAHYDAFSCVPFCDVHEGTPIEIPTGAGSITGIDFAVDAGATIAGRVTRMDDMRPLPAVVVRAHDASGAVAQTTVTDGNGQYRLAGLAPGAYTVSSANQRGLMDRQFGGQPVNNPCVRAPGTRVAVDAGATRSGVDIALPNSPFTASTLEERFSEAELDSALWDRGTFVRRIRDGKLLSRQTQRGRPGNISTVMRSNEVVESIAVDVRVEEFCTDGGQGRARIFAYLFATRDAPNSPEEHPVYASVELRHTGKALIGSFFAGRCIDEVCAFVDEYFFDQETFGELELGRDYRLSLGYDGDHLSFGIDGRTVERDMRAFAPVRRPLTANDEGVWIGTRVSRFSASHESASITALFDNVSVNGALYDDFPGPRISPSRWSRFEFGQEVENGQYRSEITARDASAANRLHIAMPDTVRSLAADVTVLSAFESGALARARLSGFFYNDGSEGPGETGEVQGEISLTHSGGRTYGVYLIGRCEDEFCNDYTTFVFEDADFGDVEIGSTHRLSIELDGSDMVFGFDAQRRRIDLTQFTPTIRPPQGFARNGDRFMLLGTRVFGIEPFSSDRGWITATFDNVVLGLDGDADRDGIALATDKCPQAADPANRDSDADGVGDACDAFPTNALAAFDTDGDRVADAFEILYRTQANDPSDAGSDLDFDGKTLLEEFLAGTDPLALPALIDVRRIIPIILQFVDD